MVAGAGVLLEEPGVGNKFLGVIVIGVWFAGVAGVGVCKTLAGVDNDFLE